LLIPDFSKLKNQGFFFSTLYIYPKNTGLPSFPHLIFTVTNDLSYDQRMQRICRTLAKNGYQVTLIGRTLPDSLPLETEPFFQKRLRCHFKKGFVFYAEYNLRLFRHLLFARYDAVCSIDLDTLPAGCLATLLRRKQRVFDAHEYFTEVPEVKDRFFVKTVWEIAARTCLPFYRHAYTVGKGLSDIFQKKYNLHFEVVRNVPEIKTLPPTVHGKPYVLLYQGALNEGRGIETALEAMRYLPDVQLWLAGEGDLSQALREKTEALQLGEKVQFLGYVKPKDLPDLTAQAWLGINLLENRGLSYYYSLANKYFDYVQAGIPVITMDFPEYRALQSEWEVGILLTQLNAETLAAEINNLLNNNTLYENLQANCRKARQAWNWENEQIKLLEIWSAACPHSKK